MRISEAILALQPGAQFTYTDEDLSTLIWHDLVIPRPTDAEINAKLAEG